MTAPAGAVYVEVRPDLRRFREQLRAGVERASRGIRADVDVGVDTDALRARLRAAIRAATQGLGDIDIPIGGGSNASGAAAGLFKIGAVAAAIAPALSLISTLLAGLPAVAMAAAAAGGALYLGWDGVKKAFEQLTPQVDALKAKLSSQFEVGLAPVVKDLGKVFPILESSMPRVVQGLVGLAGGFTNAITSAAGLENIDKIVHNTGTLLQSLAPSAEKGMAALLQLAASGSQVFQHLQSFLAGFTDQFAGFVSRITANEVFGQALGGLSDVLLSVTSALFRLMEIGIQFMPMLAGPISSAVTGLTDLFVSLYPVLASFSGAVFSLVGSLGSALAPVVAALAPAFTMLFGVVTQVGTALISALGPAIGVIANAIGTVLVTALTALQPLFAALLPVITQIGQVIASVLLAAFQALAPVIAMAGQALGQIVTAVTPLLPALSELASVLGQALISVIQQVAPLLADLASTVFPILVGVVQAAVPVLIAVVSAVAALIPPVVEAASSLLSILAPAFQAVLAIVRAVWPAVQAVISAAVGVITGLINILVGVLTGNWAQAWEGAKQVVTSAWNLIKAAVNLGITAVVALVRTVPGLVVSALGNLGSLLVNAGRSLIDGFISGIRSMIGPVVSTVSGLIGRVRALFPFSPAKAGPFAGKGYTLYSGKALMSDWAKGMALSGSDAVAAAARVADDVSRQMTAAGTGITSDIRAAVSTDTYGTIDGSSIATAVESALSGWSVDIDSEGLATLVNKSNTRRDRRG